MGMYNDFLDIIKYLKSDEELLRLLYYPSENGNDIVDPLDNSLPNIMDMDIEEKSEIINKRIMKSDKTSDLVDEQICRIYVYAGRRSSERNYLMAEQELVIDIFCHSEFEIGDLRSLRISDRLNQLFCQERVAGIGKMDFVGARPITVPYEFTGYQCIYKFGSTKS
ncbi:hypothetical protein [Bacillus xiapuensis]|uniref:Uncharacterized protein n=1 Tax=Bacillus xiapuensis TaxID=2014075 RepID=A0ABU6N7Q0_9BACI|nr:hypothetical protein [Bacillus xiapuensis]